MSRGALSPFQPFWVVGLIGAPECLAFASWLLACMNCYSVTRDSLLARERSRRGLCGAAAGTLVCVARVNVLSLTPGTQRRPRVRRRRSTARGGGCHRRGWRVCRRSRVLHLARLDPCTDQTRRRCKPTASSDAVAHQDSRLPRRYVQWFPRSCPSEASDGDASGHDRCQGRQCAAESLR